MSSSKKSLADLHPVMQVIGYLDQRAPFPIGSLLLALLSGAYLSNPGFGLVELLPDNIPWLGNLDEGTAGIFLTVAIVNIARWWRVRRAQRQAQR